VLCFPTLLLRLSRFKGFPLGPRRIGPVAGYSSGNLYLCGNLHLRTWVTARTWRWESFAIRYARTFPSWSYRMSQDASGQTVVPCSQCGHTFAHSEVVQLAGNWVCGDCKPAYLSRVMATGGVATSPRGWSYGGFWIRFGARMIDGIVLGIPLLIALALLVPNLLRTVGRPPNPALTGMALFGSTFFLFYFLALIAYEILFLKYRGATPGKMATGLKVVRSDGSDLGWGTCVGRFVMWNVVTGGIPYLNFILMTVSSIMAGTDAEKRALHDRVCDTRVVFKQSVA
jgi:uncharacterized RDD family membrane protein YckC